MNRGTSSIGLSVHDLTVVFGTRIVLERLSIDVKRGEWLTLLGNSGCGKTTLLRSVAGFLRPSSGQILLHQRDVLRLPAYKRQIGFVHQQYALFPHLTVFQNVSFGLRERRIKRREIRNRVESVLQLVHLSEAADLYPSQLSGGMQQRVALARSLVLEPEVLLLDEPLSALDTNLRVELRQELRALHQRYPNLTIVYVTHDREEAMTLSDRIALLEKGRIEQLGTPHMLYQRPVNDFVARYLGVANRLPKDLLAHPELDGSKGQPYLRPEHIRLDHSGPITLQGVVIGIEWLGSHHRLRVQLDDEADVAFVVEVRVPGLVPMVGEVATMSFGSENCFYV